MGGVDTCERHQSETTSRLLMDRETKLEVQRRTEELRVQMTRSSTTPRRILYLSAALQRMVDEYPRSSFPEVWDVLDQAMSGFNRKTAAMAIFDAEEIDESSTCNYTKPRHRAKPTFAGYSDG